MASVAARSATIRRVALLLARQVVPLAVLLARLSLAQEAPPRLPVPDAASLERARKHVEKVFQSDVSEARTLEQKAGLAGKMLEQALVTNS